MKVLRLFGLFICGFAQPSHVKLNLAGDCEVALTWSVPLGSREGLQVTGSFGSRGEVQSTWLNRSWLRAALRVEEFEQLKLGGLGLGPWRLPCANSSAVTRVAVVGDLGVGENGTAVLARMRKDEPQVVLHLGDLANNLSSEEGSRALEFLEMIEPLASRVPYMTLAGDRDPMEIYKRLFRMPSKSNDPWYSFTAGYAKFIMLWTEAIAGEWSEPRAAAADRQMRWLEEELKRAAEARASQPWLVVAGHRPLYCSVLRPTCSTEAAKLRAVLEPLFVKYDVDLYLASHVHAYERTFSVLNGSVCTGGDGCGPVHLLNGAAGDPALEYKDLPARFTAQRHPGRPGYGEITMNATMLQYRQLDATGTVSDQLTLSKVMLPDVEENFLEAVGWLAFATALATSTCGFVQWVHADGLKRRNEAIRHLRTEIAVLSGLPIKAQEAESLVEKHDAHGLH